MTTRMEIHEKVNNAMHMTSVSGKIDNASRNLGTLQILISFSDSDAEGFQRGTISLTLQAKRYSIKTPGFLTDVTADVTTRPVLNS